MMQFKAIEIVNLLLLTSPAFSRVFDSKASLSAHLSARSAPEIDFDISLPSKCLSLMPTYTYYNRTDALFTVCAETLICAPVSEIYDILIDFDDYHYWNTFVIQVHKVTPGEYRVGTVMDFVSALLLPNATANSTEVITVLEPNDGHGGAVTAWKSDPVSPAAEILFAGEHVTKLIPTDEGVRYVSWETYYGVGAAAVQTTVGPQLQAAFETEGNDLKRGAEAGSL
jgi:hypothetical protein